jgi:microcystin-dependent protein
MMAAAAKYRDDMGGGGNITGGSASAYTLTSQQIFDSFANADNKAVSFVPHATNAAGATLNVDGLGAKILLFNNAPVPAGVLIQNSRYTAVYNGGSNGWALIPGGYGTDAAYVPIGGMIPFAGSTAPSANWALPAGQAVSRTTFAALFALIGTTYGAGDGSTTFNLPDLRGRALFGKDDMGGSAASRVTAAGSGINGTTLGATGGAETVTLATSQIPSHTHANVLSDPGHAHAVSGSTGGVSNQHQHAFSGTTSGISAQHSHSAPGLAASGGFLGGGGLAAVTGYSGGSATQTGTESADHSHTYGGGTGSENADHSHGFSTTSGASGTGASVVNAAAGGGLAHNNMPPTTMVNYIMRVS